LHHVGLLLIHINLFNLTGNIMQMMWLLFQSDILFPATKVLRDSCLIWN